MFYLEAYKVTFLAYSYYIISFLNCQLAIFINNYYVIHNYSFSTILTFNIIIVNVCFCQCFLPIFFCQYFFLPLFFVNVLKQKSITVNCFRYAFILFLLTFCSHFMHLHRLFYFQLVLQCQNL